MRCHVIILMRGLGDNLVDQRLDLVDQLASLYRRLRAEACGRGVQVLAVLRMVLWIDAGPR